MEWLSPDGLFGLTGWSRLGRAVGASLFFGTLATILVATVRVAPDRLATRGSDLRTLRSAGRRFLPARSVDELLAGAPATGPVPARIEARLARKSVVEGKSVAVRVDPGGGRFIKTNNN